MASIKSIMSDDDIRKATLKELKKSYKEIGDMYTKIIDRDLLLCPKCGEFLRSDTAFYLDKNYATERYPICKRCILAMVEQRKSDRDEPNETRESVQYVLKMMDRIYDEDFYMNCVKGANDGVKERNRVSPFSTYITTISSLPAWKNKTWKDSVFKDEYTSQDDINENSRTLKSAKKRFGLDYNNADLVWLENEYQDWVTRHECNTKAQEELFKNLSTNRLERKQAVKDGKPTKEIDKTFQELLAAQNIQPRQTGMDNFSEGQVFGTLIQKWEETRPLPEIDPELDDVDNIGKYIDVFFRGHTSKMLGLKNAFSHIYENFMRKYTVNKPQYDGDEDSEAIFEKVFGSNEVDEE